MTALRGLTATRYRVYGTSPKGMKGIHTAGQAPHEERASASSPAASRGVFDPILRPRSDKMKASFHFVSSLAAIKPRRHTDIVMVGLLGHHVAQINSVRQAMWQQYTMYVIGSTIIFAMAAWADNMFFRGAVTIAGELLCLRWQRMYFADRQLITYLIDEGHRFQFPLFGSRANPTTLLLTGDGWNLGQQIRRNALLTIVLFLILHIFIFVVRSQEVWSRIGELPFWRRLFQYIAF